jgi:Uma2 family endonuclease
MGLIVVNEYKRKKQVKAVKEQPETYDPYVRYEIIEGIRYDMQPSPKVNHQVLVTEVYASIRHTCHSKGIIIVAPMDVHFDEENVVQPDLIFISNENAGIIRNNQIHGTPDLLVEILSPSSGQHDKIRKRKLYEKFGVKEYWIVDPIYSTVDQFVLNNGQLGLHASHDDLSTLTSPYFPCIAVDLQPVFQSIARFKDE